jgi:O-antigen ligase
MLVFYFLIFIMPLSKHHIWGAIAGDFTGIKYIGMVCFPYALFHITQRRIAPPFFRSWQARIFLAFYFIATFSYLTSNQTMFSVSHWLSYTSFLVFFFITIAVVDSVPRLRWVIVSGIGAIGLAGAYVARDWQLYHNTAADYRPGWIVGDPNYFTVDALIFLPVAMLLLQQKRPRWQRIFFLGCLAVTLAAVMFSASRGGFLGLVASCLYFLWKSPQRTRNFILVCIAIAVLSLPMRISPGQRLLHPTESDAQAGQIRLALWSGGLKLIELHPIFGVGLDNFSREVPKYIDSSQIPIGETVRRVAHNSYMEIAAELGIPALLMFVGIIVSSVRSLEKMRLASGKSGDEFLQRVALGLQAGIVGASVALFFVSGEYQKMFWLAIFLSACIPSLVRSESASLVAVESSSQGHGYPIAARKLPLASRVPARRSLDAREIQELQDSTITTGKPRW